MRQFPSHCQINKYKTEELSSLPGQVGELWALGGDVSQHGDHAGVVMVIDGNVLFALQHKVDLNHAVLLHCYGLTSALVTCK